MGEVADFTKLVHLHWGNNGIMGSMYMYFPFFWKHPLPVLQAISTTGW